MTAATRPAVRPLTRLLARALAAVLAVQFSLPAFAQVSEDTVTYEYDALGNPTRTIDALGHERKSQYDSLNRLIQQLEPHPTSTTNPSGTLGAIGIAVDGQGQTTGVTDPRNLATTYTVDGLGNVTAQVSPDTGTTTRTYDAAGNLKTELDARGVTATYTWDALNRLTKVVYSKTGQSSETLTYTWDSPSIGRLGTLADPAASTSWSYDLMGRPTAKTQTRSNRVLSVRYDYDSAGRPIVITYPSGRQIGYGYDIQGRIQSLWLDGEAQLSSIAYSPFGAPTGWTWAGGRAYSRTFDGAGRLKSFTMGESTRTLTYDGAWRITGANDAVPPINRSYLYDNLDRLTSEPTISRNYAYDLSGNRTLLGIGAASYAYTYATAAPLSNRLFAAQGPLPPKSYSYNEVGAITGDGQKTYAYNLRGRLATLTTAAGTSTYEHNGLGQRTAKTVAGVTTRYVYDEQGHLLGEYDASGNALSEYVWLGDTPILLLANAADQRIVDNSDTASVTVAGTWATASSPAGFVGGNLRSHIAAATTDSFTWKLNPATSQSYRLYVRYTSAATNSTTATYTVTHAGGTATVVLNQQADGGQWRPLGTYTFTTGAGHNVKLAAQANGVVIADAVKLVPVSQQASVFFIHADQIDTPRIVQDNQYRNRWAWDPDGFGQLPPNENPAGLGNFTFNLRMPGQYFDAESGLFYNHFRDYDPQSGRYVESDPIGLAGGVNTYAYGLNDPLSNIDSSGLFVGDPTAYAAVTKAVATATGVATSTVAVVLGGIVAAVYPSSIALEPEDRPWRRPGRWLVYVRCHVKKEAHCENCPDTIGGKAYGSTFGDANAKAQSDANANLGYQGAKHCQARHCHPVACFENGQRVRCPMSGL